MKIVKPEQVKMENLEDTLFTGLVKRQPIVTDQESEFYKVSIIHFPAGVRNKLHIHECDQVLIVTKGSGIVADENEEIKVTVGDIIQIPAGEKHWHGAGKESEFAHITITTATGTPIQLEE